MASECGPSLQTFFFDGEVGTCEDSPMFNADRGREDVLWIRTG